MWSEDRIEADTGPGADEGLERSEVRRRSGRGDSTVGAAPIGALKMADAPQMFVAAFVGFLLADATLIFAAGLPAVRTFFLTHGVAVTRVVGVIFILFGARSIADAAGGAMRKAA